jgi:hypothetical protein
VVGLRVASRTGPFSAVQQDVEQEDCDQRQKLAQLLPNSCGQSKKVDSKDKNSATTER